MKKLIIGIVIVLFLGAIILMGSYENKPEKSNGKPTVKIGVVLPLTGSIGLMGQSNNISVNMAIDKIKNMDTKYNYDFIIENTRSETKGIALSIKKLVEFDKIPFLVSITSRPFKMAKNYSDKENIINIGCSLGDSIGEGKYNFNTFTSSEKFFQQMVKELEKRNLKNVGVFLIDVPGAEDMWNNFKKAAIGKNINFVFDERVPMNTSDFKIILSKIKNHDLDMLFLGTYPFETEQLIKEMILQKIDLPITSVGIFDGIKDTRLVENQWFISTSLTTPIFMNEYKDRTDISLQTCAPQIYNGIMILVEALENAKSSNINDVADYINNMKTYDGVTGKLEFTDTNFNQISIPTVIIRNGKMEVLEE